MSPCGPSRRFGRVTSAIRSRVRSGITGELRPTGSGANDPKLIHDSNAPARQISYGAHFYSAFTPASRMTLDHLAPSLRNKAIEASGVRAATSNPSVSSFSRTSDDASVLTISR